MSATDDDYTSIWVEVPLEGTGFADDDEFDLRDELEEQIEERAIGTVSGAGSGAGWMDVSFYPDDVDAALIALRELLLELQIMEHVRIKVYDHPNDESDNLPTYDAGECLSFRFRDGEYGAAIVLSYERVYLLGILDYKAVQPPSPDIFEKRNWLIGTHPMWRGKPFSLWYNYHYGVDMLHIGTVALRPTDPTLSQLHLCSDKLADYVLREKMRHTLQ